VRSGSYWHRRPSSLFGSFERPTTKAEWTVGLERGKSQRWDCTSMRIAIFTGQSEATAKRSWFRESGPHLSRHQQNG
jgi:hypothetical protein